MRLCFLMMGFSIWGCGAKSGLEAPREEDAAPAPVADASVDAASDPTEDGGLLCGDEQACLSGQTCCAAGRCIREDACCDERDCRAGYACVSARCTVGDLGCGLEELTPTSRPANLMILLDHSNSMATPIGDLSKWEIAVESLRVVLPRYEDRVRYGLSVFPSSNFATCEPGIVNVPLEEENASQVVDALDQAGDPAGFSGTPIADTLAELRDYADLFDPEFANFVLLLSDGTETCLGRPVEETEALYDAGAQVYVIGYGSRADRGMLEGIARAAHTDRPGGLPFYSAEDQDELLDAFNRILAAVVACEFELQDEPPNPREIYVYLGEAQLARDASGVEGWDFDAEANRVTFFGQACQEVRSGAARVRVVFGGCD